MSYGLSFSSEFFTGDGINYGGAWTGDCPVSNPPCCVADALAAMPASRWKAMARDVFRCEPHFVDVFTVMAKIEETDTCSDLRSPVEVWIDPEGFYTVEVHEYREGKDND